MQGLVEKPVTRPEALGKVPGPACHGLRSPNKRRNGEEEMALGHRTTQAPKIRRNRTMQVTKPVVPKDKVVRRRTWLAAGGSFLVATAGLFGAAGPASANGTSPVVG